MTQVLLINRYFYPDHSATAQLVTELAEDLASRGEHVTVITSRSAYLGEGSSIPTREEYKGVDIIRVMTTRFGRGHVLDRLIDYMSFYFSAFWAAVQVGKQDCLVVMSDPPLLSVLAAVTRWFTGSHTMCWMQDIYPEIAIRAGVLPSGVTSWVLHRISVWSLRRMDRTVTLGRCMKRHLLQDGLVGDRVITIPNWADGSVIHPVARHKNEFVRTHGLEKSFVVMYSGNFGVVHESEAILTLIRNTQSLLGLCFCFIGEGTHTRTLREMAARERWNHVRFFPYQAKESLRFSLSAGHLHLVSLREDMVGLSVPSKIYGIMAAGRPMLFIGPEESEVAALIRQSQCGFVVRPGDPQAAAEAVRSCYRDRSLCEQKGLAAREYFDRYGDRFRATEQFLQVIQKVAA